MTASPTASTGDRVPPARRIRRITAGAGLAGFTLLLVPQTLIDPMTGSFLDAAIADPGGLLISALLLLGSALLTFPAIGGILHQARDRGALLADLGALFAALGALGHAALAAMSLLFRSLAGGDPAQMLAFEERMTGDPALGAVGLVLLLSFGIGLALSAWAAARAGLIGLWAPVLVTIVVLAHNLVPADPSAVVDAAALGLVAVVFGWLGVRVIALPDAGWEAPVEPAARVVDRTNPAAR